MVKETEIEVKEETVQRVYCDDCGAECTDDHKVEPKDVCKSCSSDSAVNRVEKLMMRDEEEQATLPKSLVIPLTLVFPFTASLAVFGALTNIEDSFTPNENRVHFVFAVGSALWTAITIYGFMHLF